ncbi:MAG: hypothetical protein HY720_26975 [Planctomycetes bacterium]|nr:hypothetical protein [Planctomycetota bacterium]
MKVKLTVTIDEDVVPRAKRYARAEGLSLSRLIERSLLELAPPEGGSFSSRWRGRFRVEGRRDPRHEALVRKYL